MQKKFDQAEIIYKQGIDMTSNPILKGCLMNNLGVNNWKNSKLKNEEIKIENTMNNFLNSIYEFESTIISI